MTRNHDHPVALVTGAARRIGKAIALELAAQGYRVALHYHRSRKEARAVSRALTGLGVEHSLHSADQCDVKALRRMVAAVAERWGRLDVLVNSAAIFPRSDAALCTPAEFDRVIAANLRGPFFLCQAAFPWLKKSRGCIVNLTDIHARRPLIRHAPYSISKAGLEMMTKSLALEWARFGIRVNAIAPGAILFPARTPARLQRKSTRRIPLGRTGTPREIAQGVLYLAGAEFVTGHTLIIDGGRSIGF